MKTSPVSHPGLASGKAWNGLSVQQVGWLLCLPFLAIFALFVVYPLVAGVTSSLQPANWRHLWNDPLFKRTVINSAAFVLLSVNLKMFLALLLSSYLMVNSPFVRLVSALYLIPWAVPIIPGIISFRWLLNSEWGLLNEIIWMLGGEPVYWLTAYKTALGSAITFHIWKNLPFWTLTFMAGRKAIDTGLYEAAAIDGATPFQQFRYITFPSISRLYLICTTMSMVWTMGDFVIIYLLTGGGPADSTHVLSTLAFRYAFQMANPALGMTVFTVALPFTLLLVFILMRWVKIGGREH